MFVYFSRQKRSDEILVYFKVKICCYFNFHLHQNFIRTLWPWKSTKINNLCLKKHYKQEEKKRSQKAWLVRQQLLRVNRSPPSWRNNLATHTNGLRNRKRQEKLQEHLAKPRGDLRKHAGISNRLELWKSIAVGSPKKPTKVEATLVASYTTHSQPFRCVSFPSVEA